MASIQLDQSLDWRGVVSVAGGAGLSLSDQARDRIDHAHALVRAIVERGTRVYGVNTGIGALCDVVVARPDQERLSRNIVRSHACGVGSALGAEEVRAIIAAQINNFAHGYSGVRVELVEAMLALLDRNCLPVVPEGGSVGYLTHMAHIALVLIGEGYAKVNGVPLAGDEALARINRTPLILEAKEGLSLVNGAPCAAGFACLALDRAERFLGWADAIAALSFEALGRQPAAFDARVLAVRPSPGLLKTGKRLRDLLMGSALRGQGLGTQDALSLRAVPHVHGAAWDVWAQTVEAVDRELKAATDNPIVMGSVEEPIGCSEAHAVATGLGMAADSLAAAVAQVAAMAERRLDRLLNPNFSGLPAFLAAEGGACSGLMIAQYSAVALVAENRRLAAPAGLDGGVTSALQEDHLSHATSAASKLLAILDNARRILAIELLAAAQAREFLPKQGRSPALEAIHLKLRATIPPYQDDRPLGEAMAAAAEWLRRETPEA